MLPNILVLTISKAQPYKIFIYQFLKSKTESLTCVKMESKASCFKNKTTNLTCGVGGKF